VKSDAMVVDPEMMRAESDAAMERVWTAEVTRREPGDEIDESASRREVTLFGGMFCTMVGDH